MMVFRRGSKSGFVLDMAFIKILHKDTFKLRDVVNELLKVEPSSRIFCTGTAGVFEVITDRDLALPAFVGLLSSLTRKKFATQEGGAA